ncbi:MAG: hypothetical protein AB1797_06450 [bacterium]
MLDARSWILDPLPASRIEHRGSRLEYRVCALVAERLQNPQSVIRN